MDWLDKCAIKKLDQDFKYLTKYALDYAVKNQYLPLKLETLRKLNKELYHKLNVITP
jgi:hypothetical protein